MRVLVIGGYGIFGTRLARRLLQDQRYSVSIAGRSAGKGSPCARQLSAEAGREVECIQLDTGAADLAGRIRRNRPDIVVNAAGPYRDQAENNGFHVARACIAAGCHSVDLADSRPYVAAFCRELDAAAKRAGVALVAGASTVPGLSCAVIDACLPQFAELCAVEYAISPGNRTERGPGTVSSILSYTGRPFSTLLDGRAQQVYGWQDLAWRDFGHPLGRRWLGNCDIPDLDLLPQRYPRLRTVRFQAGLEFAPLHLGLWLFSWLSRAGLVRDWSRYSRALTRISEWFIRCGTDRGGMLVHLTGTGHDGRAKSLRWRLVAENGVGPNIPVIPTELAVGRIAQGRVPAGARPCVGLFTLAEFSAIAQQWNIYQEVSCQ